MPTTRLSISGMHCASCVASVEKALARLEGVEDARVNLATASADVVHGEQVEQDQLVGAVGKAGYEAAVQEAGGRHDHHGRHDASIPRWRIAVAALALPVVVLGMAWMSPVSAWIQLACATPVQVLLGWPFYVGTRKGLQRGRVDMDALVAIGTSVAFGYSLVVVLRGDAHVYFDTAVVILVLIHIGKHLEHRATAAAGSAIGELLSLQPAQAIVVRQGGEHAVPIDDVKPGDTLLVKPGASVPVDGQVADGRSSIDQSLVTGESAPVDVEVGDTVYGGTVNQAGAFRMTATQTGEGMLLAQVAEQVRSAQASKAGVQRLADRVASVFVPAVLLVALGTFIGWAMLGGDGGVLHGMHAAIAVLIVACPCALGLATPTAIMVASGLGAKFGILIKDAAAFERAGGLTHVLFDKTGTLTRGRPSVTGVHVLGDDLDPTQALRVAAAAERSSEHPIAAAIVRKAGSEQIDIPQASEFESLPGGAIRARVEGRVVIVGRVQTLRDAAVQWGDDFEAKRKELFEQGQTTAAVSIDNQAVALLGLADELRAEAPDAIAALRKLGLRSAMVTGDHQAVADHIARALSIERVYADCLPDDKRKVVADMQRGGRSSVAMVGDGINDAPALAAADLGIAVAGGTDIAKDAGHIVLVGADLMNVPRAVTLSRATMKRIWIGLGWAFGYNVLLIPVAAAGWLHPMLAAGAMSLSSVSVVANALWLRRSWKPE